MLKDLNSHKSDRAVNDTHPQEMSWGKSSEKNSKQGQLSGKQIQEVNCTYKV